MRLNKEKPMNNTTQLKELARDCGNHFFTPGAMRFFNSRVSNNVWGGRYFITSERYSDEPRRYTVREFVYSEGRLTIDTVGEFQEFGKMSQAIKRVRELVGGVN
jgi:hypothetical protein